MNFAQCISEFGTQYGLMTSLFLGGLFGGATHCSVMCAPFVLAQTKENISLKKPAPYLLLPYHFGRMTTYVGMAILVSGFINLAFLFSDSRKLIASPLLFLAAIVFLVNAFPYLKALFPWASGSFLRMPFQFLKFIPTKLFYGEGILKRYLLGVMLGFMPCGLVISALLAAASEANPLQAGMAMAAFTTGTMPALIFIGFTGQRLQIKFPKFEKYLRHGAMGISAIWLFILAGWMMI